MPIRNHRPDLNGVLVLDKPLGWTSARACAHIRKRTRGAKVGHAGTLDPLATGVLVLCLGKATKAIARIQRTPKRYTARVNLSHFTTTDDAEGQPVPPHALDPADFGITAPPAPSGPPRNPDPHENTADPAFPDAESIQAVLADRFTGEITQRPPNFSAVKIAGRRAYDIARAGDAPDIKPKRVRIHHAELTEHTPPDITLAIDCSKGTYIRALARDLGLALGTGGYLAALRRNAVGPYTEQHALDPATLDEAAVAAALTPPPPADSAEPADTG